MDIHWIHYHIPSLKNQRNTDSAPFFTCITSQPDVLGGKNHQLNRSWVGNVSLKTACDSFHC